MNKKSERKIIKEMLAVYRKRLAEVAIKGALEEVDVFDNRGNMLIAKDLKVRHKKSGYEYTVDHTEGEGDDTIVYLRHPEEPRFLPSDSEKPLQEKTAVSLTGIDFSNIAGGQPLDVAVPDKVDLDKDSLESKEAPSLLAVKKKEFEKDYEVE